MRYKQDSGFTVFELVIVLALFVSALALSMPAISNWQRRTELNRAENALMQMIADAKRNAIQSGIPWQVTYNRQSHRLLLQQMEEPRAETKSTSTNLPRIRNESVVISPLIDMRITGIGADAPESVIVLSPVGTINAATVRIAHRVGWSSTWITHRLAGDIRAVTTKTRVN